MGEDRIKERGFEVEGRVQGVGFRWWTVRTAREEGLTGWVRNRVDGTVEVQAAGPREALDRFAERLGKGPPAARVTEVREVAPEGPQRARDFEVRG